MKNKKLIIGIGSFLVIASLLTTGCGKEVKISKKAVVGFEDGEITANDYYKEIKTTNISKLVDMIDLKLFKDKYPSTDKEDKDVKDQIDQIKSYYSDESTFNQVIAQYFGAKDEKELEEILRLEYKREQAVNDYVEKNLKDDEIKKYYDENYYGDMSAKHILIAVNSSDDATDEEKAEAEEKALEKAKKVIKKLNDGEDFDKLAKKYSDDKATASKGGDLGSFAYDDMVAEFSKACAELKVDEYTKEPVKSSYGYHIILKTKQEKKKALKKVKTEIKEKIREQKLNDDKTLYYNSLIEIREENGVTWNDNTVKKAYNELMDNLIKQASSNTNQQ
ncbi:MAG: peptidylprolyl isomerase [Bacilli bacterium]|nr:peptidylprolyl isomerase [Bacilli bacterium]